MASCTALSSTLTTTAFNNFLNRPEGMAPYTKGSFFLSRARTNPDHPFNRACYQVALDAFNELIKNKNSLTPHWASFFMKKAQCECGLGKLAEAEQSWRYYAALVPEQKLDRKAVVEGFRKLGNKAFEQKNFELAVQEYSAGMELAGANELLLVHRYCAYEALGRYGEAVQDILAAEASILFHRDKTLSKGAFVFHNLGNYYRCIGKLELADAYLSQAIREYQKELLSKEVRRAVEDCQKTCKEIALLIEECDSSQLEEEVRDYCDAIFFAIAYKRKRKFATAKFYTMKAEEYAITYDEKATCAFMMNALLKLLPNDSLVAPKPLHSYQLVEALFKEDRSQSRLLDKENLSIRHCSKFLTPQI